MTEQSLIDLQKLNKVINSCKNREHGVVAYKMTLLFFFKHGDCTTLKDDLFLRCWRWVCSGQGNKAKVEINRFEEELRKNHKLETV